MRFRFRTLLAAAAAVLFTTAAAAERSAPPAAQAALAFYEHYGAADLDALASLATPELGAALRTKLAGRFRTRCLHLVRATVTSDTENGTEATVGVDALLTIEPRTGGPRFEAHAATFHLVSGAGGWRIAAWELREEGVARALAAAPSDKEREAILAASRDAATPLLSQLLATRALQANNDDQLDLATSLSGIMERIARASGDLPGLSLAKSIDCMTQRNRGPEHGAESVQTGAESVALAEAAGDPDVLAKALLRYGRAQYAVLAVDAPLDPFERAMALGDDLEEPSTAAHAANALSSHYGDAGDHYRSLFYAHLAERLGAASGNALVVLSAEMHIAWTYDAEGDLEVAAAHFQEALRLSHQLGYRPGELIMQVALASAYRRLGDGPRYLRLVAETLRAAPDAEILTPLLRDRTEYYLGRRELPFAERDALAAVAASPRSRDRREVPLALLTLAKVRSAQGRGTAALALLDRAAVQLHGEDYAALAVRARTLRKLGRRAAAVATYRQALRTAEGAREAIAGEDRQRRLFFSTRAEAYVELADLLVEQGDVLGALAVADESKGRTLLDILDRGRRPEASGLTGADRQRERELTARITVLRTAADPAALRQAQTALDVFRADVDARDPNLRLQRETSAPLTRGSLAALLPDRHTALVEYLVTGSRLHAFVVRKRSDGLRVAVHTTTIGTETLASDVERLVAALSARAFGYEAPARRLYDRLLGPLQADLQGATTICIIPDGMLWRVPFEALLTPHGRFVASRMATFYAPSVAVYARMARTAAARNAKPATFLAFADPPVPRREDPARATLRSGELTPLPDAAREVEQIARLYGSGRAAIHVGRDALERRVKEDSAAYDVLHFATHGVLDDRNPMYSHLLLAPSPGAGGDDGLLEAWEMMRLDLHADLAVLSACDTARGTYGAGEGIIGMSWAIFAAGCPSTIATEWQVDSASAADLMLAFYKQWLHGRSSPVFAKAEALRQARLELLRDPRRRHPFYWAPYVLIGSGR